MNQRLFQIILGHEYIEIASIMNIWTWQQQDSKDMWQVTCSGSSSTFVVLNRCFTGTWGETAMELGIWSVNLFSIGLSGAGLRYFACQSCWFIDSESTKEAGRRGEPCSLHHPPTKEPVVEAAAEASFDWAAEITNGFVSLRSRASFTSVMTLFCDPARKRLVFELSLDRNPLFKAAICSGHTISLTVRWRAGVIQPSSARLAKELPKLIESSRPWNIHRKVNSILLEIRSYKFQSIIFLFHLEMKIWNQMDKLVSANPIVVANFRTNMNDILSVNSTLSSIILSFWNRNKY